MVAGGDGDGSMNFHDYEGGGIGEGEGTKDISDKIENEDQVMNSLKLTNICLNVRRIFFFLPKCIVTFASGLCVVVLQKFI